jgi:hypothetical protein
MSLKPSNLTSDERTQLLEQLKTAMGSGQYNQLRRQVGEDKLLEYVLDNVPGIQEEVLGYRAVQENIDRRNRGISMPRGAILGLFYGLLLVGFAWLINHFWGVPFWHSLAPAVNGALPMLISGALLTWISKKEKRKFAYLQVLTGYLFISLIGGAIGAYRWNIHSDWSVKNTMLTIWEKFQYIELCMVGVFLLILGVLWVIENASMGKGESNFWSNVNPLGLEGTELVTYWAFITVFAFTLPITFYAVIADAFHFNPWVAGEVVGVATQINRLAWLIVPAIAAFVGMMLGLFLPAKARR